MLSGAGARSSSERARVRRRARPPCWLALCAGLGAAGVASPSALAGEPGLTVETGSPDALCPELSSTRAAVQRRIGQLIVPEGASFTARYTIGHAPSGSPRDFVRLELFGPDGEVQLSRDLPLDGEACSTMAEVIALVLDRHFRTLLGREPADAGDAPALEAREALPGATPVPAERAEPAATPEPTSPASAAPSDSAAPSERAAGGERAAAALAGPRHTLALELAYRGPASWALGGRALLRLWKEAYGGAALHASLVEDTQALAGGGEVASRELVARAFGAWAPRWGGLTAYVGPGIRASLARGTGRDLPQNHIGYRASWAVGVDAGALWRPGERWVLSGSAALDFALAALGGRFAVDGVDVLEPAPIRLWLGVGVGYSL